MRHYLRQLTLALAMIITTATIADGADPYRLDVSPRFGRAPQDIHVITRIEPDPANRTACVEVDGPMYQSTCQEIDGSSPRTRELWLKGFPGGCYEVRLVVVRNEAKGERMVYRNATVSIAGAFNDPNGGCDEGSEASAGLPE